MASPLLFLNDDSRLLEALRRGEERPLHRLYASCMPMVHRYVTANSGSDDDAADMLQEALVIVWERVRAGSYTHDAKLSTFVMGTVHNLWHRRLARMKREPHGLPEDDLLADGDPDPYEQVRESEDHRAVSRALDTLGDPCRTLLILFYWDELSMDDIARRMGFANAATAKARKHQCKQQLGKLIRQSAGDHD